MKHSSEVIHPLNLPVSSVSSDACDVYPQRRRQAARLSSEAIGWFERTFDFGTIYLLLLVVLFAVGGNGLRLYLPFGLSVPTAAVLAALVYSLCIEAAGAYSLNGSLLRVRETACLLRATVSASLGLLLLVLRSGAPQIASLLLLVAPAIFLALIFEKSLLRSFLRRSGLRSRVLLFGTPELTRKLQDALVRSPRLAMDVIAVISSPYESCCVTERETRLIQSVPDVESILVAQPQLELRAVDELRSLADKARIPIFFLAGTTDGGTEIDHLELDGQILYGPHQPHRDLLHAFASRVLDVVGSVVLLTLLSIPLAVAALLVRISSTGPVFFRQVRTGRDGNEFTIYKFRTMYVASCGDSRSPTHSSDPRITPVGKFLRKTSVDELPQLFNVLRGEMALVGPRPEMPFIVATYRDIHKRRLSVKPGLTGLWQISEFRSKPIHENIEYDLYYLKYRSISVDMAILLHTLIFAVRGI